MPLTDLYYSADIEDLQNRVPCDKMEDPQIYEFLAICITSRL